MAESDRGAFEAVAPACPACGQATGLMSFTAYEKQFGSGDAFRYLECAKCGTLRIEEAPRDLGAYYPPDYYAFSGSSSHKRRSTLLKRTLAWWLTRSADPLARWTSHRLRYRRFAFFEWVKLTDARFKSRILDVGCGGGGLLRRLQEYGFRNLHGVDPFAPREIDEIGLSIRRAEAPRSDETFDIIMVNHALEHMPDPAGSLIGIAKHLAPTGRILVRIPLAGGYAHWRYGNNWVHLDAPRHLVIPTLEGFRLMATRSGLRIIYQGFDGEEPSFLLSESYIRNLPLAHAHRPNRAIRVKYRKLAHLLNETGQGDYGVFVLEGAA